MGVCCRMPDQEVDEAFDKELKAVSESQTLVLVEDLNYPDIFWRSYTEKHKQSRRFLKSIGGNFLAQMAKDPTRYGCAA